MVNIIIPAAGEGRRFSEQGYLVAKPLIPVLGKPMIQYVLDQFNLVDVKQLVVLQSSCFDKYKVDFERFKNLYNLEYVLLSEKTEGTACTVLKALGSLDLSLPCIIANVDQVVDIDLQKFVDTVVSSGCEGCTMVFEDLDPKWSYCEVVEGRVVNIREKEVISNVANVGIYYFQSGKILKDSIEAMVEDGENSRVRGEFYLAPAYRYLLKLYPDSTILPYSIDKEKMHSLGVPEDLITFTEWKSEN